MTAPDVLLSDADRQSMIEICNRLRAMMAGFITLGADDLPAALCDRPALVESLAGVVLREILRLERLVPDPAADAAASRDVASAGFSGQREV